MASLEAKNRGNAAFTAGRYEEAVAAFSEGIDVDPQNHILYSNRSGAYAALKQYEQALQDAEKCISLNSQFVKGYSRKGLALFNLRRLPEARDAYQAGLKLDANNDQMKDGLRETEQALRESRGPAGSNPLGNMFGESMWTKLAANPKTAPMLKDPQMLAKLKMLQANPQAMMQQMMQDPQLMTVLSVIMGINLAGAPGAQDQEDAAPAAAPAQPAASATSAFASASASASSSSKATIVEGSDSDDDDVPAPAKPAVAPKKAAEPQAAPKSEPMEVLSPEEEEKLQVRKQADEFKNAGNELYKKRQFDAAVEQYNRAIELDGANPNYLLNRAAVRFEQKQFEACVADCQQAVQLVQEQHTPDASSVMGKAYARIGNAHLKQGQFAEAIQFYKKSLLENSSNDVRQKLKEADELKRKKDEQDYQDPAKSAEANELGKQAFQAGKWAEAIAHYSEAIKRNPKDAKLYSNRAACYAKLMTWGAAIEDCDHCIKLDPAFVKAYSRKGRIQHGMKDYHKALSTLQEALKIDPQNQDALDALAATRAAISEANATGEVDPERQKRAMEDPEIQSILKDPIMSRILNDMQTNPASAQGALKDPVVRAKLDKLIAAGIIRVG